SLDFPSLLRTNSLRPSIEALVPFARWITPSVRPKRFDTHFFLAMAPEGQLAVPDASETTEVIWIDPNEPISGSAAIRFKLVFPTRMNLLRLARRTSIDDILRDARAAPIIPVMPEFIDGLNGQFIRIPEEA